MVRQVARPPRGYQETNRNERGRLGIEELEWEVKSHIRRYGKNATIPLLDSFFRSDFMLRNQS